MTVEEAIKHAEKIAKAETENAEFFDLGEESSEMYKEKYDKCLACAAEHRQLAEWLKNLKKVKDIIKQHDKDSMPEDFWYIDRIREVVNGGNE